MHDSLYFSEQHLAVREAVGLAEVVFPHSPANLGEARDDRFAPERVRFAHDGHIFDARDVAKRILDSAWCDIDASTNDQILYAPGYMENTGSKLGNVSGWQRTILRCGGDCSLFRQITCHGKGRIHK